MKFPPHYFEDLLYAMERREAELTQVTNAITAFCQGIEDKWLDKVVAFVLSRSERGSVERSIRNLEYLESESMLANDHGSKAEAHFRLSGDLQPDTIRKIVQSAADGEGIGLALFIRAAKSEYEIDPEVRKVAIVEIAKIKTLLLSDSEDGQNERAKFGDWNISSVGKSEESAEILEDYSALRRDGVPKTQAREQAGAPHGLNAGAVRQRIRRSDEVRQQAESRLIETLTKPRKDGSPETLIDEYVFDAVLNQVKAGKSEKDAFELVAQQCRLQPSSIALLFEAGKKNKLTRRLR